MPPKQKCWRKSTGPAIRRRICGGAPPSGKGAPEPDRREPRAAARARAADRQGVAPGDGLLHPIPIVALVVLVLNDHWWKRASPGVVTGKLSDLAGMAFFPLLLQALWEIARAWAGVAWGPSRRALLAAMLATGVVFGLAKTTAPANALVRSAAGVVLQPFRLAWAALHGAPAPSSRRPAFAQDPSDLAALPALLLARLAAARRRPDP